MISDEEIEKMSKEQAKLISAFLCDDDDQPIPEDFETVVEQIKSTLLRVREESTPKWGRIDFEIPNAESFYRAIAKPNFQFIPEPPKE